MKKPLIFYILVLEDQPSAMASARKAIRATFDHPYNVSFGFDVEILEAQCAEEFAAHIGRLPKGGIIDLALIDQKIKKWRIESNGEEIEEPNSDQGLTQGSEVLSRFASHPQIRRRVVLTANTEENPEIKRLEEGASEYWQKQEMGYDVLRSQIESIFDLPSRYDLGRMADVLNDNELLLSEVRGYFDDLMVGQHPDILRAKALICEASLSDVPVLITGETGTGKEVVARLIHSFSKRGREQKTTRPFSVNCAEYVDEQLLRSELFGHRKGAFTGADKDKQGLLFAADGSTLFLDEVGLAPQRLQGLLLRAFEEGMACPVGATKKERFDVRFIAATDQQLFDSEEVKSTFSKAFLNRLSGIHIHLPTLKHRVSDIRLLVNRFLRDAASKVRITEAAWRLLEEYQWPGNVRQLKYVTELQVARCKRSKQEILSRYDFELVLPDIASATAGSDSHDSASSFASYMDDGAGYDIVKNRFLAHYVHWQHHAHAGENPNRNDAYQETADRLDCSVTTVKEKLRDYRRFFGDGDESDQ